MGAALVGELTADGSRIVLIANGPDYTLARLAKTLQELTPLFTKSNPPGALTAPLSWATVVQLGHAFGSAWAAGPRLAAWVRDELTRRVAAGGELTYTPPEGRTPRPYQVEGALMLAATGRVLLFDEQGTGKTITTILGLVERANAQPHGVYPVVCVVPASTVDPWIEAWRTWAPHVRVTAWRGAPAKRLALAGTADVYVTSYDTARVDAGDTSGALVKLKPAGLVVDECHLIKSPHAMRSLAVRRLAKRARSFVALSGTPITHTPDDLWPTLEALAPTVYPAHSRFTDRYCAKATGDYAETITGLNPFTEPEFRTSLLGQHRRVAKADVLTHLPPKIYSTRVVELPPAYRKAYDAMEDAMVLGLREDGSELSVMSVLAQLTRLAQLASAAADVTVSTETNDDGEDVEHVTVTLKAPSWKVDALIEILDERPGQRVVAFAPSRQLVMLAAEAARESGRRVGLVVGGQTMTERTDTVNAFQAGGLDLLCVTTAAGGVGLTLTAAGTVAFLQRPWSIVDALQAEDRCHRIGSERHDCIEVIDIVAADTIDSRVRAVLHEKAGQLADLLQDQRIVTQLLGGQRKGKAA
jgi:SNF2 family DNA or RNA helicase